MKKALLVQVSLLSADPERSEDLDNPGFGAYGADDIERNAWWFDNVEDAGRTFAELSKRLDAIGESR